jgi:hypothetical protein
MNNNRQDFIDHFLDNWHEPWLMAIVIIVYVYLN